MYPTYQTKIAAALGLIALVLLAGGNANAQVGCYGGTGWEEVSRAVKAIEAVDVEVRRLTSYNAGGGEERFYVEYSIDNEHSCLAGNRSSACVKVTPDGMGTSEFCIDSFPTSWAGYFKIDFGGLGEREIGLPTMTAQVRVRYYGSGGSYTPWSSEFSDNVPLVFHYGPHNRG